MEQSLHSTVDLGKIAIGDHLGWLVANTDLEASWAPVNKGNGAFGFESGHGGMDVLGNDVSTIEQTCGHVLAVARITLHHLVIRLEARHRDLLDGVGLVSGLDSRDYRRVGDEREMNSRIRHQIGLELVQVDVQRAIEAEGGSNGRDD